MTEKNQIDLVIPCHTKDIDTLHFAIEYARKNIEDLRNIYVVSKKKLTDNAIWISEDIFPFTFQDMIDNIGDHFRTGWYYAGWLHLYSPICIPGILENVLICDADTIFIKPVSFLENGKGLLNISFSDGSAMYTEHLEKLLKIKSHVKPPMSGICHHVLMNRHILKNMMERVEKIYNRPFYKAWIDITKEKYKGFCGKFEDMKNKHEGPGRATSYELYFTFATQFFPNKVKIRKLNSILCYKGRLNMTNNEYLIKKNKMEPNRNTKSRTNLIPQNQQIIDSKIEDNEYFDSVKELFKFIIKHSIKKNFVQLTLPDHARILVKDRKEKTYYSERNS